MKNTYEIKKLKSWLANIKEANTAIEYISDEYAYGIDYEDEDGEHELTSDDLDAAFHLLCKIEEALNSELNYYEKEEES